MNFRKVRFPAPETPAERLAVTSEYNGIWFLQFRFLLNRFTVFSNLQQVFNPFGARMIELSSATSCTPGILLAMLGLTRVTSTRLAWLFA